MKTLTKLISLSICGILLVGCSNKAQDNTTKTTNDNNTTASTTTKTNQNNETKKEEQTTVQTTSQENQTDLTNLDKDSKQIYDIIVAKYPNATLLTDDENKLITDYNNKYGWLHGYLPKTNDESKKQTTYINMLNLSTDYQKYSELIAKHAEKQYIDVMKSEIDRVLNDQKF